MRLCVSIADSVSHSLTHSLTHSSQLHSFTARQRLHSFLPFPSFIHSFLPSFLPSFIHSEQLLLLQGRDRQTNSERNLGLTLNHYVQYGDYELQSTVKVVEFYRYWYCTVDFLVTLFHDMI